MNTDRHTFAGKRKVGRTEICDFTDYQGIGRDPLYKRYENVYSIVRRVVPAEYAHFLAAPDYSPVEDTINWYIDEWSETPRRLVDLVGAERDRYERIKKDTVSRYRKAFESLGGEDLQVMACALRYVIDDFIYCCDGRVFLLAWGMTPDRNKHISLGELVHESPMVVTYKLRFSAGEHGVFAAHDSSVVSIPGGTEITHADLPRVLADEGFEFAGWSPSPIGTVVEGDMDFTAVYRPKYEPPVPAEESERDLEPEPVVRFDGGGHGVVTGDDTIVKARGTALGADDIPDVKAAKGYTFRGWDVNPLNMIVDRDVTFTAMYDEVLPWYKRLWRWFLSAGWKWLLWLLLLLLSAWILTKVLSDCSGCSHHTDPASPIENTVDPLPTVTDPDGTVIDDNGGVDEVVVVDDRLPEGEYIVAPVRGEGGALPPIVREPGRAPAIANRLVLFLEDADDDIDALAADFKRVYPGNQYAIIGYDREVKSMVIQVPEAERGTIRETINERIPNHRFIVFDDEIYELNSTPTDTQCEPGWHLDAVGARQAWQVTKGSPEVVVAVVDDGIDAAHPIFKGRIVKPYNVFTQSRQLSTGQGHGTHTAGLAAGSVELLDKGVAGIAPDCKVMPIQVFDNGMCPLSALVSGIMYAVHKGADVVNVSIGPSFPGLKSMPESQQEEIARREFKNVERLWNRVCQLAEKKNTIIVFAAGNDNILSRILPENRTRSAITVGAVDPRRCPAPFSNYGRKGTDISAPGTGINSSLPGSKYGPMDGTSMSAPIVAGAIALMKSLKKDLTVEQAYNVLYRTGADVYGDMPPMVRVDRALDAVRRGDFSKGPERPELPMPAESTPAPEVVAEPAPGYGGVAPAPGIDLDEIRRLIEEHQREIDRLKKILFDNQK